MNGALHPALATALLILALSPAADAASFTPYRLVYPETGREIEINGVSGDGRTFFGLAGFIPSFAQAVRWDETNGFRLLGRLPGATYTSFATGSSFDGARIIGQSSNSEGLFEAFVWDEAGGIRALEAPTIPYYESGVRSMTPDGSTLVGGHAIDRFVIPGVDVNWAIYEAFRWTESEGLVPLGAALSRQSGSVATAISDDGSTIVGWTESPRGIETFVWTAEEGMELLGGFDNNGRIGSNPTAVSADGSVIVGRAGIVGDDVILPFIYTRAGGMRTLFEVDGRTDIHSSANDISADGSIIVGETYDRGLFSGSRGEAFIWDAEHGVRSLKSVLESLGVDLDGWQLNTASSILADGRTIFGYATDPAGTGRIAYLAVIPEPGTSILLGLGLAAMAFGRFRGHR